MQCSSVFGSILTNRDRNDIFRRLSAAPRPQQLPVQAVQVPAAALQQLASAYVFSHAQEMLDPITQSPQLLQWAQALSTVRVPVGSYAPTSTTAVIVMAPVAQQLSSSLAEALLLRPAMLCCYVPAMVLSPELEHCLGVLQQQHRAQVILTEGGLWLVIASGPCSLRLWRGLT
jgi:hypothetical protein